MIHVRFNFYKHRKNCLGPGRDALIGFYHVLMFEIKFALIKLTDRHQSVPNIQKQLYPTYKKQLINNKIEATDFTKPLLVLPHYTQHTILKKQLFFYYNK